MSPTRKSRCVLRRLARSDGGGVAPFLGLTLLFMIGCVGFGIDVSRAVLVKARLSDALDAAGLAVGARVSTTDFNADALKFVSANFRDKYAGATVTNVTATPNATKTVISLSAEATMPTSFMKLFGTNVVVVRATSEITRASTGLELVLALDNTGSMASSMTALKKAAKDLLDIVYGGEDQQENLYAGLVPFSHTVNIGTGNVAWMDPALASSRPSGWSGCIEERVLTATQRGRKPTPDTTDDPPVATDKPSLFSYYKYPGSGFLYELLRLYNQFCPKPMLPMSKKKSVVSAAVDTMTADGNTHVNMGAVWGWRMLSPKWRGYWGGDMGSQLPLNYNTPRMNKALVLMTDGANTMSSTTYTAYGNLSDGRLGTTNETAAVDSLDNRLTAVCTAAKNAGIIVYSVVFNVPADDPIEKLMQGCASKLSFYFPASDEAKLNAAFKTIGDSLSNLRVSK